MRIYHLLQVFIFPCSVLRAEKLNLRSAGDYYYLKQSNCLIIDGIDDAKQFHILLVSCITGGRLFSTIFNELKLKLYHFRHDLCETPSIGLLPVGSVEYCKDIQRLPRKCICSACCNTLVGKHFISSE